MKYLLDADWSIDYLSGVRAARALFPTLAADGAALSRITLIELYTGIHGSPDPRRAERELRTFLRALTIIPLNHRVVLRTARLRYDLRSQNRPIKTRAYDLIVAATALEYGLTLVSSNVRDYQDIPDLMLYNPRAGRRPDERY